MKGEGDAGKRHRHVCEEIRDFDVPIHPVMLFIVTFLLCR